VGQLADAEYLTSEGITMRTNLNTSHEAAVRHLIEDWAAAVRRKDFAGILRHHSSEILMFDVPPPLQSKGLDEYRRTWELFFSWAHEPVLFDIAEMTVTCDEEVAFVAAIMRCSGGEDIDLEFRLTVGLRRIDGHWTVMHEHHSIPATQ
jgi:ketosteroid isomerase-like protein